MSNASEYLADILAVDAEGEPVTIRIGTCGYVTSPSDDPPNVTYIDAISDPGDWTIDLADSGRTMGSGHSAGGNLSVVNTDGTFDPWTMTQGPKLDGRPFVMRRLDGAEASYASADIVATGVIDFVHTDNGWVSLELGIVDRSAVLDTPLQTNRYAGTTTSGGDPDLIEGGEDLQGQPKKLLFGTRYNVEPVCVDTFNELYQVSDGPVTSIVAYEGMVPLVNVGDFPNVTALITSLTTSDTIKTGQFGTVLSAGVLGCRLTPTKPLTCDVVEGTSSKPGAVMRRILERHGQVAGTDFDAGAFAALDAAAPYDLGIEVQGDENCSAALDRVKASVGAWLSPDALGMFLAGRFTGPGTPSAAIDGPEMVLTNSASDTVELVPNPDTDGKPVWRVVVNYAPVGLVMDASQIHDCVDTATRAFVGVQSRQVIAEDESIRTLHPQAGEMTITTELCNQADAQAFADLLLSLHGVERKALRHSVRREDATFAPNDTATITLPRLGFEAGRDMALIGMRISRRDERVETSFWG